MGPPSGTPVRIFEADLPDPAGKETFTPPGNTDQWSLLPLFEQMNASYVSIQRERSEPQCVVSEHSLHMHSFTQRSISRDLIKIQNRLGTFLSANCLCTRTLGLHIKKACFVITGKGAALRVLSVDLGGDAFVRLITR